MRNNKRGRESRRGRVFAPPKSLALGLFSSHAPRPGGQEHRDWVDSLLGSESTSFLIWPVRRETRSFLYSDPKSVRSPDRRRYWVGVGKPLRVLKTDS